MDKETRKEHIEVNICYVMALAIMMLMRDARRRLAWNNQGLRQDKKRMFTALFKAVENVIAKEDAFDDDVLAHLGDWRDYETWQEDYNAICRLMLLWVDRCDRDKDAQDAVFKALRSLPSQGIFDEDDIAWFYLKKIIEI